jgi:membrane associated rhomboid family serine protease
MSFSSRPYVNRYVPSNRFPTGLKWLLAVNTALFVISYVLRGSRFDQILVENFALVPAQVVQTFAVWQVFTYMFLHEGFGHILWNMLSLWMFGAELERLWGTARFLRFYLLCGICSGILVILAAYLFQGTNVPTIGSSGAIFGILMAYALMFPDRTVLFGFLIPVSTRVFVAIIGAVVLLQSFTATVGRQAGTVAVVAHLGGLITGYLLIRGPKLRLQIRQPLVSGWRGWKLRRAKRKFEVYLRSQKSDKDRWVH